MLPNRSGHADIRPMRAPMRLTVKYVRTTTDVDDDDGDGIHGTHSFRPVGSSGLKGSFRPVGSFQHIRTTNIGPSEKGGSLVVGKIGSGPPSIVHTPGGLCGRIGRSAVKYRHAREQ